MQLDFMLIISIDEKSPTSSPRSSPPVVSNLSTKRPSSTSPELPSKLYRDDDIMHSARHQQHSFLSRLKLCVTPSHGSNNNNSAPTAPSASSNFNDSHQKRSISTTSLPPTYYHHSFGPYHPQQNISHIITSGTGGGIHNHTSHQHPHHPLCCSECLFLRRYCNGGNGGGGGIGKTSSGASCNSNRATNIPSSSTSSANNVATNNMQFSSLATPCGPTSSSVSASFTWMANPSIYDNSSIISPVAGMLDDDDDDDDGFSLIACIKYE